MIGLDRGNVSRELNELVDDGLAIKTKTRPVKFADKQRLQQMVTLDLSATQVVESFEDCLRQYGKKQNEDPFSSIVGASGSLETAIRKAKAAILYPAGGMHTLLAGPTGVGKSMFAEKMYQYGKIMHLLDQKAEFVIFNCAEYADNPQLLISQLFGHMKGSYTGADREKPGLVERANHGILFLDEIHRLTPEGQEMLFLLMDKGVYRKLGETGNRRKADVTIIGATTENLEQSLLRTFIRRMPVVIELPSLKDRSHLERLQLIEEIFMGQARKIQTRIRVHRNVLTALLHYDCKGNIGQLVADIRMICAEGFLEYKTKQLPGIRIEVPILPDYIYQGLLKDIYERNRFGDYFITSDEYYYFDPYSDTTHLSGQIADNPSDIYTQITQRYTACRLNGMQDARIQEIICNDIQNYFSDLLNRYQSEEKNSGEDILLKLRTSRIYQAAEDSLLLAERKLNRSISADMKTAFAMYIDTLCERIEKNYIIENKQINQMACKHPNELKVARMIRRILEEELNLSIPDPEVGFITMFLCAVDHPVSKRVGIVIAAHGDSTASSMAGVVNTILNTDLCRAVDMQLTASVENALENTLEAVQKADEGKGVLLLTDMGSLTIFHEIISRKIGISVMGISMVSTPLLLEAARKSLIPGVTLKELWNDLYTLSPDMKMKTMNINTSLEERRTIITTCVSGKGTAQKIATIIRNNLPSSLVSRLDLLPIDITRRDNTLKMLMEQRIDHVVAVVGTIDLQLPDVPFISIEQFITQDGIRRLQQLLVTGQKMPETSSEMDHGLFIDSLGHVLEFLDPAKTYRYVEQSFCRLKALDDSEPARKQFVRYLFHVSCMIERLLKHDVLPYENIEAVRKKHCTLFKQVQSALNEIETIFELVIPDTEIGYILDIIETDALLKT